MTSGRVDLYFFIDALGWELLRLNKPDFLIHLAPHRKPLRTILGYSSACDPSIISGLLPSEHLHWSSYYYSPSTSPFRSLKWLSYVPSILRDNHRFRHYLSQWIAHRFGYTGYFQLYTMPFEYLSYFDYAEKEWIYQPHGLLRGKSIFDLAYEHNVPYHVSRLGMNDETNLAAVKEALAAHSIAFAYVTLGKLDALGHQLGNRDPAMTTLLNWYETELTNVLALAHRHYDQVGFYLFSDHGMTPVTGFIDLQRIITELGFNYGSDYVATYDSTMARFWFFNSEAKQRIEAQLKTVLKGHILNMDELKRLGVYFPDSRYGETIFLLEPGQLIVPSFMGKNPVAGMHGYHPDDPSSDALLLSNQPIDPSIQSIHHIFELINVALKK